MVDSHVSKAKPRAYLRVARGVTAALCYLFAAAVALQVFIIGMVFLGGQGQYLEIHRTVGHSIGVIAILACLGSLVARMPWRLVLSVFVLLILYVLQYTFIDERNGAVVRAFHSVNAVVLFWLALEVGQRISPFQKRASVA